MFFTKGIQTPRIGMTTMKSEPKYRSGLEKRVCDDLKNRGIKFYYEPYQLNYTKEVKQGFCPECGSKLMLKCHQYTPDVVLSNGIHVEIKGKFTGEMRTKMIAVQECNPDVDIRILFQADNWLTKKKATKYSDWCKRNGFIYHVGEKVPSDWVT